MLPDRTRLVTCLIAISSAALVLAGTAHAAPRAKSRLLALTPDSYVRVVTVATKQKERKYYVMATDKPIEFSVTGPTALDISTRLLFLPETKGEQRYTVSVTQDTRLGHSQEVAAAIFTTRKSPVSTLTGGTLVPGEGRRLKVIVPSGRHRYRIHLSGTAAREAGVRILIPRNAIRR